jgi:hypothetical protein
MERDQAIILENRLVTIAESVAKQGSSVARLWCKHVVEQPYLRLAHSAQTDCN